MRRVVQWPLVLHQQAGQAAADLLLHCFKIGLGGGIDPLEYLLLPLKSGEVNPIQEQQDLRWEKRFVQLEAKVDSNHRVFIWTQAIIMAAVILPYLERLMALCALFCKVCLLKPYQYSACITGACRLSICR